MIPNSSMRGVARMPVQSRDIEADGVPCHELCPDPDHHEEHRNDTVRRVNTVHPRVLSKCFLYAMRKSSCGTDRMPWGVQRALGGMTGWLGLYRRKLMRRRRGIAEANLACCFPRLGETQSARGSCAATSGPKLGLGLITRSRCLAWWGSELEQIVTARSGIVGSEHLEAALSHGRGSHSAWWTLHYV